MRVLVTGSSGHVGGATAAHLQEQGHEVVGLSRRLTKSNRRLSRAVAADISRPGLVAAVTDLASCDAVVHAAASLDHSPFAPEVSLTNGLGTQQLLELARSWGAAMFVYISGVPVIGRPRSLPITEEHPTAPLTAYHASKLYGEHLCEVAATEGMSCVSLRVSAPVGPGMPDGRILSVFVAQALASEPLELAGEGTRGQDYVDVRDVASAVERSLATRPRGVLNIASGRCVSNVDLARSCVEVLGSSSEVRFSGRLDAEEGVRWEVSIERAGDTIGYQPAMSLTQSIEAVADDVRRRLTESARD